MGSTMLQMSESVGSFMKGSIVAVSASGTTSMSLAWMGIHPRIDEPSNPRPSSKTASVSSASGMLKCCQSPMKSMNLRSTITAFLSAAYPMTSLALGMVGLLDRGLAALAGAHADGFLDGQDEDLAVADAAGPGRGHDRLDHAPHQLVRDDDLQLDLRQQVHRVFRPAIQLGVPFLPAH